VVGADSSAVGEEHLGAGEEAVRHVVVAASVPAAGEVVGAALGAFRGAAADLVAVDEAVEASAEAVDSRLTRPTAACGGNCYLPRVVQLGACA
jgi:hypothetical protein